MYMSMQDPYNAKNTSHAAVHRTQRYDKNKFDRLSPTGSDVRTVVVPLYVVRKYLKELPNLIDDKRLKQPAVDIIVKKACGQTSQVSLLFHELCCFDFMAAYLS